MNVVQSNDPAVDTLKCPKCKAIWRAKGAWNCGDDRWDYEEINANLCPRGCINFFGFRLSGKIIKSS